MTTLKTLYNFGIEHPARTTPFKELKKGLFLEVDNGNINVSYHPEFPHLAIFKYSLSCVVERNWNKFTLMARGLILDLDAEKVVATPFVKFFNLGEIESGSYSIIEPEFTVMEKIDGSLGIMFHNAGEWRIATAGSFVSDQAKWAMEWMNENMPLDKIDTSNTYLFEIIYDANKIVVQYDYEGLVLLGIVDSYGLDYSPLQLEHEASYMGTKCAKVYNFSDMDSIVKQADSLGVNEEGYVIRFKSGIRVKVKGSEYVRVHKLISKVTPLAVWESMLNGDDLEEIKKELPEEMEKDYNSMVRIMEGKLSDFIKEVEDLNERFKSKSDKELGMTISMYPEAFRECKFKTSKGYIYLMRRGEFFDKLNDFNPKSLTRRKIFTTFKPKANYLEGYVPSSAMNRFNDDM